jgi:hypothetical protein
MRFPESHRAWLEETEVAAAGSSMISHPIDLRMICGCNGRTEKEHFK